MVPLSVPLASVSCLDVKDLPSLRAMPKALRMSICSCLLSSSR
jgi:hypothetical protein